MGDHVRTSSRAIELEDSEPPPASGTGRDHHARATAREALRVATEAHEVLVELRSTVGASPDPARKVEGTGLLLAVSQILRHLEAIHQDQERARARWSVGLKILGAAASVVAIAAALNGLLR